MTARMICKANLAVFATFSMLILGACGSSGPDDTTIALNVNAVDSPTNEDSVVISGSTDANSAIRIEAPLDTVDGNADGQGSFSFGVELALNQLNSIALEATDPAGNRASDTISVLHDNIPPTLSFSSPGANVAGQSGFTVTVALDDESSGTDPTSLTISNDQDIGGAFKTDGTFSASVSGGDELVSLFSVSGGQAAFLVPDTFFFRAGTNQLSASISDNAGNSTNASHSFTVQADDPRLIIVDASGAAGDTDVTLTVGLANGVNLSGVQFDVAFDTLIVDSITDPTAIDRASGFSDTPSNEPERGRVRVLLFDGGGAVVSQGQGPVLQLTVSVNPTAPTGDADLTFQSIVVSEPGGSTAGVGDETGKLTVQ